MRAAFTYICLGLAYLSAAAGLWVLVPAPYQWFMAQSQDMASRLMPVSTDMAILDRLVFVDIDERSLQQAGQWPWPRQHLAQIINALSRYQPAVIGIDILFSERDRFAPDALEEIWNIGAGSLDAVGIDGDEALAHALDNVPAILAAALDTSPARDNPNSGKKAGRLLSSPSVIMPVTALADYPVGIVSLPLSHSHNRTGAQIRSVPLVFSGAGEIMPSFALGMFQIATHSQTSLTAKAGLRGELVLGMPNGQRFVDAQAMMRLYPLSPDIVRSIPAYKFLSDRPPALPQDSIIIIGSSAAGLHDHLATPLIEALPGSLLQMHILYHLLGGLQLNSSVMIIFS